MDDLYLAQQNDSQRNSTHVSPLQQQSPTPVASPVNTALSISLVESEPIKDSDNSSQLVQQQFQQSQEHFREEVDGPSFPNDIAHLSNQDPFPKTFTRPTHQLSPLSSQQQPQKQQSSNLHRFDIQQHLPPPPPYPQSIQDLSPLIHQYRAQYQKIPYRPFQRYTPSIPPLVPRRQRQQQYHQHPHPLQQQQQQHSELASQVISEEQTQENNNYEDILLDPSNKDSGGMIPMGAKEFECILDYRQNLDTGERQLLIKYKHTSYHHVDWVPLEQIEGEYLGKYRVHNFLKKWKENGGKGVDFREHLKLHRVVDEGELVDSATGEVKIYYLCKWNAQLYDGCTWESEDDAERIDGSKVKEFLARSAIPEGKLRPSPPRKVLSGFHKYDHSPLYRLENELYTYQLDGLNWLRFCYYDFKSCILADEMGLGKTVQAIALLDDIYHSHGIKGPFIIIAPSSRIPHWEQSFKTWTDMNVIDYRGSTFARNIIMDTEFYYKGQDGNIIPNRYKFDVLITSYEVAAASSSSLGNIRWACGVFDEAHLLKTMHLKVGETLRTFQVDHKLLLTGTAIQNNLDEFYGLLNLMQPDIFDNEDRFFSEYGSLESASAVKKLQELLESIMLRRLKSDTEKNIPIKEETLVEVQLTQSQKKCNRDILWKNFNVLIESSKANTKLSQLRNMMMELRKCAIHPYLLEGYKDIIISENKAKTPQDVLKCLIMSSGKLVLIDKLLKKLILGNHKVLIFSQFTRCLDILSDYLQSRKYAFERIDGIIFSDQRQASIDRFSTSPINESFVFLLCTRAVDVEINLTAADTCIIFDNDWDPRNDLQALARRHRIGETKPVQVYRLICANTYERKMIEEAGMKLGLDDAAISTSGSIDDSAGDLSKKHDLIRKEIEDLFKKCAYGAFMNEEASTQFCEEDIDVIMKNRTEVIRHEDDIQGSLILRNMNDVRPHDMNLRKKWAAKTNVDVTRILEEELDEGERNTSANTSSIASITANSGHGDDDIPALQNDSEVHPWSMSEKTEYERKMMIFGYGAWQEMKVNFPRRSEKDLKAVARTLMRYVLPSIDAKTGEDKRLVEDIGLLLQSDAQDDVPDDYTIPYKNASQKQIEEFRSFMVDAPQEYQDHLTRNGRTLLLRIQILHAIRNLILPGDWNCAKNITFPQVDIARPAAWWGANEDRDMILGIRKHGYQQYLDIRNDREFCFAGKKYLDPEDKMVGKSSGDVGESEGATADSDIQNGLGEADTDLGFQDGNDNQTIYVWPFESDIDKRIQIVTEIYLRDRHQDDRKRKAPVDDQSSINPCIRQRKRLFVAPASLDKAHRQVTQPALLTKSTSIDREQEQPQPQQMAQGMSPQMSSSLMNTVGFVTGQQNDALLGGMKSADTGDKRRQDQTMTNSTIPQMTIYQSMETDMEPEQQQQDQTILEAKKDQK
ncbi:SNF2 family N-terminal domain-domain-containing protein [Absidia repens]|uniref:SNF2 family N-terminal domain-domain-containing protein n=1 Tax=Absidia repens TaxID=90262 RepID=A0A1X2I750_9FUNG|nr:SNF2 family N-terminal domain-domain-containing protein [Absidia repens]